ncbi:MAG: ribonuclease III [Clostridiales bacterium]|nr:ribonuclease III [Clostridiales bacterium]
MEESISYLKEQFQLDDPDIRTYSPLALAYIGDGIYELYIRTILIKQGNCQANKLHKRASRLVKAQTQSAMIGALEPLLTPEEEAVYKRGRNAKSYTTAKNATTGEYRRATGFEAVMGYLYLTEQHCRMIDLIKIGLEALDDGK